MQAIAVILAAGRSERFGSNKTSLLLRGRPVWRWAFDAFASHPRIHGVGIVCPAESVESIRDAAPSALFVVAGGATRTESARAALRQFPGTGEALLLHDGARPFVSAPLIDRVLDGIERSGAAAPGLPIADTVKELAPEGVRTLDRGRLIAVQTPQGARIDVFRRAFADAQGSGTDDMSLVEAAGVAPEFVPGEQNNFKLTLPEDLERARAILGAGEIRTGIGYDIHAFGQGPERLILGGEVFEDAPRLEGHSDADALLHAVCDALLGAAALGDIGQHFPNSDPRWKDKASSAFLLTVGAMLREAGWRILNIDATVIAEFPKIMARSESIRNNIAETLGIEGHRVSVKATTNERLGALGRGEGIAAMATATLAQTP